MASPVIVGIAVIALVAGCQCPRMPDKPEPAPNSIQTTSEPAREAGSRPTVEVRYLGSGGFLIIRGQAAVLTAPLYSNPFLPRYELCGDPLRPREDLIEAFVKEQGIADDLRAVRLVLSGHAHYDHLLDAPPVLRKYTSPMAVLATNLTGHRTLAAEGLGSRVVALNVPGMNFVDFTAADLSDIPAGCAMPAETGRWWPAAGGPDVGPIRVYATSSDHPPQLAGIEFWPGCHAAALPSPPARITEYKGGEEMAFLIDLLDPDGTVGFRIYYEDAPIPPRLSAPLKRVVAADGRQVDLALLCTGNWREVPGAETIVKTLGARDVILHHWEWFFDEKPPGQRRLLSLPGSSPDEYRRRVIGQLGGAKPESRVRILKPGVVVAF